MDYNILFIENENDWIDSIEERIGDYLEAKGFTLVLKRASVYPKEIKDFNQFDVIVVDLNLDGDETGDQAIKRIRAHGNVYTEILFYSSEGENVIRQKLIDLGGFDGVYCSKRNDGELIKNLEGLIYTTIRKTQDLNNLRGMVMAETSELDGIIKDINRMLAQKGKVSQERINERKGKLLEFYRQQLKELDGIMDFHGLIESGHFSAFFSWRTLKSFMGCEKNDLCPSDIEKYKDEVIELRNLLAHNPETDSTYEVMKIKKNNGDIANFREEDFVRIRKGILSYKRLLCGLRDAI